MVKFLRAIFRDPTRRDVIINTIGNNLNVVFSAVFVVLLTRVLSEQQYGVMTVLLSIAYVLSNILDFGTSATIYSYLPPLVENRDINMYRFVKSTFYYQSLFSIVIIFVLSVGFPTLDRVFFHTGAPLSDLYLTSASVLLFIWQNFVWNCMCAAKKFIKANLYQNIANLIKTLVILYLAYDRSISISSVIFVFGILGPAIFFLLLFLEKKNLLFTILKSDVKREDFKFRYTMTYFVASQFFNLGLRMDLFLLSFFHLKRETGHYGVAQKIILTIITTVVSITQVISPAFSKIKSKKEVLQNLKTGFLYLLVPSALFLILYFTPDIVFCVLFSEKYCRTAPITRALSLPFIIYSVGSLPILFLLYTVKKPKYILFANIIFFVIMTVGCYYLIPLKGVFGPPIAIGIAMSLAILLVTVASVYEFRKLKD